jgi:dienelactone hydrolase
MSAKNSFRGSCAREESLERNGIVSESERLAPRAPASRLAERVSRALDWLLSEPAARDLRIGCFGASTGAAAALVAAGRRPDAVAAVVSRGGRPDLAAPWLEKVRAPTLLIVGGEDAQVLDLNCGALALLRCEKGDWFVRRLAGTGGRPRHS